MGNALTLCYSLFTVPYELYNFIIESKSCITVATAELDDWVAEY
jgi:hypothetical protein